MAEIITRDEIIRQRDEYHRKLREDIGSLWYDNINWDSLLPDPWTALLQREDEGHTLQ